MTSENHPLYGKEYTVNNFTKSFGVTLVLYTDDEGLEKSMNVAFTSMNIINPFAEISKGRCDFRYDDMLLLEDEMQKISGSLKCKPNCVILQT